MQDKALFLNGVYETPGDADNVAIAGATVYLADEAGGLLILRYTGAMPSRTFLPILENQ